MNSIFAQFVCLRFLFFFFSFPFSGGRYRLNKMHQIFWNILHSILNTFLRIWINSNARNQHLRAEWILVQNDWQFDEAAMLVASPRAIRNELRKRKPRLPLQGIKCKTTDTRGLRGVYANLCPNYQPRLNNVCDVTCKRPQQLPTLLGQQFLESTMHCTTGTLNGVLVANSYWINQLIPAHIHTCTEVDILYYSEVPDVCSLRSNPDWSIYQTQFMHTADTTYVRCINYRYQSEQNLLTLKGLFPVQTSFKKPPPLRKKSRERDMCITPT